MDSILYWNSVALKAVAEDFSGGKDNPPQQGGPTYTSRALAIVHIAMHDAHAGSTGGTVHTPLLPALPAGAVTATAIAAAAASTLNALYPRQSAAFVKAVADDPFLSRQSDFGWEWGAAVARKVLESRAGDKSDAGHQGTGTTAYAYSCQQSHHRIDPVAFNPKEKPLHPRWGEVKLFGAAAIQPLAPYPGSGAVNPLTDPVYLAHHREVRAKGGHPTQGSTTRTPDETVAGVFWGYDGPNKLGTPPRLYNQVIVKLAEKHGNSLAENARLFFLVNIAMADAGINAWHWKYVYDLWRPVIGIREVDPAVGPLTTPGVPISSECDPAWQPLGAPKTNPVNDTEIDFTPGFPAYPSGHATFGAAAFQTARLFFRRKLGLAFGDRAPDSLMFDFVSDEHDGVNKGSNGQVRARHQRKFASLWKAIIENSISRVYLGVHWRFDGFLDESDIASTTAKVGGVPLGLCIAEANWAALEPAATAKKKGAEG